MPTRVVCAVIFSNNCVLAALRQEPMSNAGFWEFPGGKVHIDETDIQALKREMIEEFNADVNILEHLITTKHTYDHISIELVAYKCNLISKNITAIEHFTFKWFNIEEMSNLNWTPADIPIVNLILEPYKTSNHL